MASLQGVHPKHFSRGRNVFSSKHCLELNIPCDLEAEGVSTASRGCPSKRPAPSPPGLLGLFFWIALSHVWLPWRNPPPWLLFLVPAWSLVPCL